MAQQRPATTGGAAATAHGLLPLTAAATFAPFRPSPSSNPSLSPSPAMRSAESVGSCSSGEQPEPGSQPDTAGTAPTCDSSGQLLARLPGRQRQAAKRPREPQRSAGGQAPAPCRMVVISVRTLAALAAAANRQLAVLPPVPVEASGDNFADDSSEADSGSMHGTHSMHATHSVKRQRVQTGLQAAAVYRQVSAAAARMAAAAAAERQHMG